MMEAMLQEGLAQLGLPTDGAPALIRYAGLLAEWNKVMDLTAITDPADVVRLHFLDSAALLGLEDFREKRVVDVGTGAGFPGLVVAILCPGCQVTLLDPLEKRLGFIQEVIDRLGLSNVTLLHLRGEDGGRGPALREGFDFAAARAVADLSVLGELCLPFVKVGGWFLAMKSAGSDAELAAAQPLLEALGGRCGAGWDYTLPGAGITHRVWPVKKAESTPARYPRRWSKIKRGNSLQS